jgi:hypothetical protein
MAQVDVRLKRLALSEAGKEALARLGLELMERQARDGVSGSGAPLPPGVDLHQSGRLFRDVSTAGGVVQFRAPYAAQVNARYEFNSLAPQYRDEYLRRAAEIIRAHLTAE